MADETTLESAVEGGEEEQQAEKPKRNNYAELQRVKDREVAEAHKALKEVSTKASQSEAKLAAITREIEELKAHTSLSEDEEVRIKRLLDRESQLETREQATSQHERNLTIKYLSAQYGIPAEDLDAYDNPDKMEIAALKYANSRSRVTADLGDPDEEEDEPAKEETPVRSTFDLGTGASSTKSFVDMTSAELAAWEAKEKAAAFKRIRLQR